MAGSQYIPPFDMTIDRERFGDYLAGLTDGEGSFLLGVFERPTADGGVRQSLVAHFRIVLRSDDRPILEAIQSFFQCGNMKDEKPSKATKNARPTTVFYVTKPKDLVGVIIPHYRRHPLRAKKRTDFEIWCQGVELLRRVTKKKLQRRKSKGGFLPRWTAGDAEEFRAISAALKANRLYENMVPVVLPKTTRKPDAQTEFGWN